MHFDSGVEAELSGLQARCPACHLVTRHCLSGAAEGPAWTLAGLHLRKGYHINKSYLLTVFSVAFYVIHVNPIA